jgi:hypothetical protein
MADKIIFKSFSNIHESSSEDLKTPSKHAKFIKKGNYIKKEIPTRGRSAAATCKNSSVYSPNKTRSIEREEKKHILESPTITTKSRTIQINNSIYSMNPRLKQQHNRL